MGTLHLSLNCCDPNSSLKNKIYLRRHQQGFSLWLSGLRIRLVSMRTKVQFLALLSGFKHLALPQAVVQVADEA